MYNCYIILWKCENTSLTKESKYDHALRFYVISVIFSRVAQENPRGLFKDLMLPLNSRRGWYFIVN